MKNLLAHAALTSLYISMSSNGMTPSTCVAQETQQQEHTTLHNAHPHYITITNNLCTITIPENILSISPVLSTMIYGKFKEHTLWKENNTLFVDLSFYEYSPTTIAFFNTLLPSLYAGTPSTSLSTLSSDHLLELYELTNYLLIDVKPLLRTELDASELLLACPKTITIPYTVNRWELMFHEKNPMIIAHYEDKKNILALWNLTTGHSMLKLKHKNTITSFAPSPDGNFLATASMYDHKIVLWDPYLAKVVAKRENIFHPEIVGWLSNTCVILKQDTSNIHIWDYKNNKDLAVFSVPSPLSSVTFNQSNNHIFASTQGGLAYVFDAHNNSCLHTFNMHELIIATSVNQQQTYAALALLNGTIALCNLQEGTIPSFLECGTLCSKMVWNNDGKHLALLFNSYEINEHKKTVQIWDITKDYPVYTIVHNKSVDDAVWSPDGKKLATRSRDTTVKIYDLETNHIISSHTHKDWVSCIAWSPNSDYIISGDWQNYYTILHIPTQKIITRKKSHALMDSVAWSNSQNIITNYLGDSLQITCIDENKATNDMLWLLLILKKTREEGKQISALKNSWAAIQYQQLSRDQQLCNSHFMIESLENAKKTYDYLVTLSVDECEGRQGVYIHPPPKPYITTTPLHSAP